MKRLTTALIRALLSAIGALLVAIAVMPQTQMASADPWVGAPTKIMLKAPPRLPDAVGLIARDPFSGGPPEPSPTASDGSPSGENPVLHTITPPPIRFGPHGDAMTPETMVPEPGGLPNQSTLLPPNGKQTDMVTIIGTIIGGGRPPVAMISDGQHVNFAHLGDTLNGKAITSIVERGIILSDGTHIAVTKENSDTSPSPGPSDGHDRTSDHQTFDTNARPTFPSPSEDTTPAPNASAYGAVTSPYGNVPAASPPTIQPGNYPGAPPTLAPGQTAAPIPHYVGPGTGQ